MIPEAQYLNAAMDKYQAERTEESLELVIQAVKDLNERLRRTQENSNVATELIHFTPL